MEVRARPGVGVGGSVGGRDVAVRGGDGGDDGDLQLEAQAAQRVRSGAATGEQQSRREDVRRGHSAAVGGRRE